MSNKGNGLKQPADGGKQKKRPGNGNGRSKHVGEITPQEHPDVVIAIDLTIQGCKCLQTTKDFKTFAQCLAGSGEQHGIRGVSHEVIGQETVVVSKIKVGHEIITIHGAVHEYRALATKAPQARNVLRQRA